MILKLNITLYPTTAKFLQNPQQFLQATNYMPQKSVSLDLRLVIPFGFYGQIFSRSGLFLNHHITAEAAVIDSDYRGIAKIELNNQSDKKLSVKVGQRIAQMVFLETINAKFTCVQLLPETERQDSGFGSSGYF